MSYDNAGSQAYEDLGKLCLLMTTFGQRLKEARERAKLTQDQVAQFFDPPVKRESVSNWENDRHMPEADKLQILIRRLRADANYLVMDKMGNTEMGPEIKGRVPIISWVQAGAFAAVVDNFQPGDADEWEETTVPIHKHTYALRVRGDSMTNPNGEPTFPNGQVIIVEPDAIDSLDKLASSPLTSLVIVKRAQDDEATFKQLVKDAGRYWLKPLNPQYQMIELREDDVICGVVRQKAIRYF